MTNPYSGRPQHTFWRQSVAGHGPGEVDPVVSVPFGISLADRVATAGSCFAQHISRTLVSRGIKFAVTETQPMTPGAKDEQYGVFPPRFGNIYTVRQLLQLLLRAYAIFEPNDVFWIGPSGAVLDPFRPRVQEAGFSSVDDMLADRSAHLAAVREMFETCDVFVFTLGLTEGWEANADGAVFPLAPGVVSSDSDPSQYRFHNFNVPEMVDDLRSFLDHLRRSTPKGTT